MVGQKATFSTVVTFPPGEPAKLALCPLRISVLLFTFGRSGFQIRICAAVQVAIIEPVGDHDSARMLGTSMDGRADVDSEKSTGLSGLYAVAKTSFLRYRDWRFGAMGAVSRVTTRLRVHFPS